MLRYFYYTVIASCYCEKYTMVSWKVQQAGSKRYERHHHVDAIITATKRGTTYVVSQLDRSLTTPLESIASQLERDQ